MIPALLILFVLLVLWLGYLAFLARIVRSVIGERYRALTALGFPSLAEKLGKTLTYERSVWGHKVFVEWKILKSPGDPAVALHQLEEIEVKGRAHIVPKIFDGKSVVFFKGTVGSGSIHFFKSRNEQIRYDD